MTVMAPSPRDRLLPPSKQVASKTKIVLLGDHGVGKSSFLSAVMKNDGEKKKPQGKMRTRFARDSYNKTIMYGDTEVEVQLQDTAGQERFRSLTSSYYRLANGCLLFFNVNDQSSFDHLSGWMDDLKRYCFNQDTSIVIVGILNPMFRRSTPNHNTGKYNNNNNDSGNANNNNKNKSISCKALAGYSNSEIPLPLSNDKILLQSTDDERSPSSLPFFTESYKNDFEIDNKPHSINYISHDYFFNDPKSNKQDKPHEPFKRQTSNRSSLTNRIRNSFRRTSTIPANLSRHQPNSASVPSFNIPCNTNMAVDDDDDNSRVISRDQALAFAHNHDIPYREVDIERDYASVEDSIHRLVGAIVRKRAQHSVLLTDTVFLNPTKSKIANKTEICCKCSCA